MGIAKPTFKVILDTTRKKANNKFPLKLRVTYNRIRKYYNIGKDVSEEEYEKLPTSKIQNLKDVKFEISVVEMRAANIYKDMDQFTFIGFEKKFLEKIDQVKPTDTYSLLSEYVKKLKDENRISTSQSYQCTLNSLKMFKAKLTFEEITPEFLNGYEKYMLNKGNSSTTVGIYLRSLRTVYNQAIEAGLIKKELYPFRKSKFQIPASRNVKKALTIDEIEQIFKYETVNGTSIDKAKDFSGYFHICVMV